MARAVALVALLVGCDQAWQLERDEPPLCGPFAAPTQVPFHAELVDAHDFSVDSSGTRGLIYAKYTPRTANPTGVHAIKLENGTWRIEPARNTGVIISLDGGHISENNMSVGWLTRESNGGPGVSEYTFSMTAVPPQWGGPSSGFLDAVRSDTSTAGNVIVLPYTAVATIRFAVTIKLSDSTDPNTMRIFQLFPNRFEWELTAQADPMKTSKLKVNPNGGVLTADHNKLVYSARLGTGTTSRLYASGRLRDEFAPGPELRIEGVEGDEDLTEPWVNGDCTQLYFRRDNVTWMATAVDASGTPP